MRIGIDIDGVLTDIEQWQLDYGSEFIFEKYHKGIINSEGYDIEEIFKVDRKAEDEFWEKYLYEYAKNEPARKFASEVINKLKDEGTEIYIITARYLTNKDTAEGEKMRGIVKKWLEENKIYYNKIKDIENRNKIVIFDWGGVIESHKKGEYSTDKAIINLIKHFNSKEDENTIVERYYAQSVEDITYNINLEEDKWFEKIKQEFNLKCNSEEFYNYYINEFDKIEYYKNVVEYAHSLKNKCKIAILSNLGSLDKQRLDKQVDLKQFDYVWLSCELNIRKPKDKIYEIVENDCKIEPNNILFIDDSKENIEMAKNRGWNTCLATGHELNRIKEKINELLNKQL